MRHLLLWDRDRGSPVIVHGCLVNPRRRYAEIYIEVFACQDEWTFHRISFNFFFHFYRFEQIKCFIYKEEAMREKNKIEREREMKRYEIRKIHTVTR